MPLRPSPQRLRLPRWTPGWERAGTLLLAVLLAGAFACSSAPPPIETPAPREPEAPRVSPEERGYLLAPSVGFAGEIGAERAEELERAHRRLTERGDLEEARRVAGELLAEEPAWPPALVLAAQAELIDRRYRKAVDLLLPVVEREPSYVAAQLLLGRAAELLGDIPLAYASFRAVAARSSKAFERTGELHPRTLEILFTRLEDALARNDLEEADRQLARLKLWGAQETRTLEGERAVAQARGDLAAELAAVRGLAARGPAERPLLERQAELELAVGDARRGLEIIQGLVDRNPRDAVLADKLVAAKFLWRLTMLPKGLQQATAKPELTRGELAALLYWLVPNVRYARVSSGGRIATDVLDHPHQDAIVRVVNLGLLDVDSTLHSFYPGSPVRRGPALRAVQRMLQQFAPGLKCLAGTTDACAAAAACRVIPSAEDCRVGAPLSGAEAVEIIRRSLDLLGGS